MPPAPTPSTRATPADPRAEGDRRLPPRRRPAGGGGDGRGGRSPRTPANVMAHLVLVADRLAARDPAGALARVEAGLAAAPADEGLHLARLALLEEKGENAAVGAELAEMNRLFPDNAGVRAALVQWHLDDGDPDAAEAVLRAAADASAPAARPRPDPRPVPARGARPRRRPRRARGPRRRRRGHGTRAPYVRALAGLDFAEGRHRGGDRRAPRPDRGRRRTARPRTRPATSRSRSPRCSPRPAGARRAPPSSRRCSPRTGPTSAR